MVGLIGWLSNLVEVPIYFPPDTAKTFQLAVSTP